MFKRLFAKEKTYKCIFTKKMHHPHHHKNELDASLANLKGYDIEFTKIFFLPFVPTVGMRIQKFIEIPALTPDDNSYEGGLTFCEKIEDIVWRDGVFDCYTNDHIVEKESKIEIDILRLMKKGWIVWDSKLDSQIHELVNNFFDNWEKEIIEAENSNKESFEIDRQELNEFRKIWKFSRISLF